MKLWTNWLWHFFCEGPQQYYRKSPKLCNPARIITSRSYINYGNNDTRICKLSTDRIHKAAVIIKIKQKLEVVDVVNALDYMQAESHLAAIANSLPGDTVIFLNPILRPSPSWIFVKSEFGTYMFCHGECLLLELRIKFGSNASYNTDNDPRLFHKFRH